MRIFALLALALLAFSADTFNKLNVPQPFSYSGTPVNVTFDAVEGRGYAVVLVCKTCTAGKSVNFTVLDGNSVAIATSNTGFGGLADSVGAGKSLYADVRGNSPAGMAQTYTVKVSSSYSSSTTATGTIAVYEAWDTAGAYDDDRAYWGSPLTAAALDNRTDVLSTLYPYRYYRVQGSAGQTLTATLSASSSSAGAHLALYAMDQNTKLRTTGSPIKTTKTVPSSAASDTLTYVFPSSGAFYVRLEPDSTVAVDSNYAVATNTPPPGGGDYSRVGGAGPIASDAGGSFEVSRDLLTVTGALTLSFVASYDSQLAQATPVGALGRGWSHPYMVRLADRQNGTALVQWDAGRRNAFSDRGTGSFRSSEPAARRDSLTNAGGLWTLTRGDQSSYVFDSTGALVSIRNGRGQSLSVTKDASLGWPTKVTDDASKRSIVIRYLSTGKIYQVENDFTTQVKFEYTGDDLTKVTDARRNPTTYAYDDAGRMTAGSDSLGSLFAASYGADGRVAWKQDAKGNKTSYSYQETTAKDQLGSGADVQVTVASVTDRLNNVRTVARDKSWRLISYTDQLGTTLGTFGYGPDGYPRRSTDAWGVVTDYTVDLAGNVLKAVETATDGTSRSWSATYDSANNRLTYTDRAGKTWTWTYELNKVKTAKDPLGNLLTNVYNADGLLVSTTFPGGGQAKTTYQSGQPVTFTDRAGDVTSDEYDGVGRKTAHVDARGKRWEYAYDANDNEVQVQDPLGKLTKFAYDARDRRTSATDRNGKVSMTEYDANGNATADVSPSGLRTERSYDDEDRPKTLKRPGLGASSWVRDARGLATRYVDELGNVSKTSFNAQGLPEQRWDAKNVRIQLISYDAFGRAWKSVDALNRATKTEFDAEDRPVATVDNKGRRTLLALDALGRTSSVADANGGTASQSFTADGDLGDFTDPNGHKTTLGRDAAGRIVGEVTAAGGTGKAYAYSGGLISRVTNARNQASDRTYDAAGRSTGFSDPAGTVAVSLDFEGRPLSTSEGVRKVDRTFDDDGRLASAASPEGSIGYAYGATDGLLKTLSFDGVSVSYGRDADGLVSSATDWAGRIWTVGRDANRRVISVLHPNGVNEARAYDDDGDLSSISVKSSGGTTIWSCAFTKDAVGKTSAETPAPAQLPPAGSGTSVLTYVADNRLATFNGWPVAHDADGNLTTCPRAGGQPEALVVDARNRVISFGGVSYAYGAENERFGVTSGGATVKYLVNLDADLSQVLVADAGAAGKTRYVHIPGVGLVAEDGPAGLRCYHADARGSTVALTDKDGAVVARFAYGPYGEDWGRPEGSATTPFRFGGRDGAMTDTNGLVYLRARYYSPVLRRFLSRDPVRGGIEDPGSLDAYAYVDGDPVDKTDPLGTIPNLLKRISNGLGCADSAAPAAMASSCAGGAYMGGKVGGALGAGVGCTGSAIVGGSAGLLGGFLAGISVPVNTSGQRLKDACTQAGLVMGFSAANPGPAAAGGRAATSSASQNLTKGASAGIKQELAGSSSLKSGAPPGTYRPARELPRKPGGEPMPDVDSAHTQLGTKSGRNGDYTQAREFDAQGRPVRDIDFTDHGRGHPNPHQHTYGNNPTGGTRQRGDNHEPLR